MHLASGSMCNQSGHRGRHYTRRQIFLKGEMGKTVHARATLYQESAALVDEVEELFNSFVARALSLLLAP